jgi:polyisoprenoid-binding protein YceI
LNDELMRKNMRTLILFSACLAGLVSAPSARAGESYQADPVHSTVVFRVKHANTAYFWGRFNEIAGTFSLDSSNPSGVTLQFQVKAASMDTGNSKRDQHLTSPDFLNAVQFPTISFASKNVEVTDKGYQVTGDLTLHGVTRPVTVHLTPTGTGRGPTGAEIGGIEADFTIKQSDFGITKMAAMIGDSVWINVSVEGIRK